VRGSNKLCREDEVRLLWSSVGGKTPELKPPSGMGGVSSVRGRVVLLEMRRVNIDVDREAVRVGYSPVNVRDALAQNLAGHQRVKAKSGLNGAIRQLPSLSNQTFPGGGDEGGNAAVLGLQLRHNVNHKLLGKAEGVIGPILEVHAVHVYFSSHHWDFDIHGIVNKCHNGNLC